LSGDPAIDSNVEVRGGESHTSISSTRVDQNVREDRESCPICHRRFDRGESTGQVFLRASKVHKPPFEKVRRGFS